MPAAQITDLNLGMNLRDPAAAVAPGETGVSEGCDFSVPGQVRPMRQPVLDQTLPADVQDAVDLYLAGVKYRFTTHTDGLRVSYYNTSGAWISILIDASFTGTFKALPINDEYAVLSNITLNRKWKPGWTATYQWGLNTPPDPVLTAGVPLTKIIDDFEDLGDWSFTGGGGGASLVADTTNVRTTGLQSMQLTCDANETIVAVRSVALDLSRFTVPGDAGSQPLIKFSYFAQDLAAVLSLKIKLSCAADEKFDKDYYQLTVDLGGFAYVQLAPTTIGAYSSVQGTDQPTPWQSNLIQDASGAWYMINPDGTQTLLPTVTNTQVQQYVIQAQSRTTGSSGQTWTDLKIKVSDFARVGNTAGRDWSTITAISIEMQASALQAIVSFDGWFLNGGGNLFGAYWLAVAYQNELGNYGPFTQFVGPVTLEAQKLNISNLTPDTDGQTIKRRFALLGGSLTQSLVSYLEDNTSTSLAYNEDENALTDVEINFNNKKPPVGIKDMMEWAGQIFCVIGDDKIYYSIPLFYEAFPALNYRIMAEGEQLLQVDVSDQNYVAARGKGREYLTQLTGAGPAFWQTSKGADVGAVGSRLLLKDLAGGRVYASKMGLYISGGGTRGQYLPKINPVIHDPSEMFGAMNSDRAYLYFQDQDAKTKIAGIDRVMRVDYRLGKAVAHYVGNFKPTAIFADEILGKVYYALGAEIYEFDAGTLPLPTLLTIPEQMCGKAGAKDFVIIDHELSGEAISFSLTLDRVALPGTYALPVAMRESDPVSLPMGTFGNQLGIILSSTTQDFTIFLPIELVFGEVV